MEELKPCPFCGEEANLSKNSCGSWDIGCTNGKCDMCARSFGFDTKETAIKAWNTRAERTCHPFVSPDGAGWYAIGCSNCGHGFADNNPDKAYLLRISKRSDIMPRYCSGYGAKVEVVE